MFILLQDKTSDELQDAVRHHLRVSNLEAQLSRDFTDRSSLEAWYLTMTAISRSAPYRSFLNTLLRGEWSRLSVPNAMRLIAKKIDFPDGLTEEFMIPLRESVTHSGSGYELLSPGAIRFLAHVQIAKWPTSWKKSIVNSIDTSDPWEDPLAELFFYDELEPEFLEFLIEQIEKRRSPRQLRHAIVLREHIGRQVWRYPAIEYHLVHFVPWHWDQKRLKHFLRVRQNCEESHFLPALDKFGETSEFYALRERWRLSYDLLSSYSQEVQGVLFYPGARLLEQIRSKALDLGHLAVLITTSLEGKERVRALEALGRLNGPPRIQVVPRSERRMTTTSRNPVYLIEAPIDFPEGPAGSRLSVLTVVKMYSTTAKWEAERMMIEHYQRRGLQVPRVSEEIAVDLEDLCWLDARDSVRGHVSSLWSERSEPDLVSLVNPRAAARALLACGFELPIAKITFFQYLKGQSLLATMHAESDSARIEDAARQLGLIHAAEPVALLSDTSTVWDFLARTRRALEFLVPDMVEGTERELRQLAVASVWSPVSYYKDATPRNWIVTTRGQLYPIDFETNWRAPIFFDLVNLFEYGDKRDWSFRRAMLDIYWKAAGHSGEPRDSSVELSYAAAILLRAFVYCEVLSHEPEDLATIRSWLFNARGAIEYLCEFQSFSHLPATLDRIEEKLGSQ